MTKYAMMRTQNLLRLMLQAITLLLCCVNFVQAGEPPADPLLRIEAGGTLMSSDARGKWLALASNTGAQIWDVEAGRLLRTLRYPQDGDVGQPFAPYLSPDGKWVALLTCCNTWEEGASLYIFDRSTGQIKLRTHSPFIHGGLSWSPDGQWIVATTKNGFIVYRSVDLSVFSNDENSFNFVSSINFSNAGIFAATSRLGEIRLYQISLSGLHLISKATTNKIDILAGRFSPNGELFAVTGFAKGDDDAVEIFSTKGSTISSVLSRKIPMSKDFSRQVAASVAWSADGKYLYAGSQMEDGRDIWRWDISTNTPYTALVASDLNSDFQNLTPLPNGQLAYHTHSGWGLLDATGKRVRFEKRPVPSFVSESFKLHISSNGKKLAFAGIVFDLDKMALVAQGNEVTPDLRPPITESTYINVTDWEYPKSVKLGGKPLTFFEGNREENRVSSPTLSLAISPDNSMFVIGHYHGVTAFNPQGKMIWNVKSYPARHVNISRDGQLLAVASDDSIVTWYRLSDGKKLLQFFVHSDLKRWVMWTPSGYYDASPGAEDLIGWQLNRGKDQAADFFPASRFRERFNRPDVLAKVLETSDENEAVRLANLESGRRTQVTSITQVLPPVVEIVSPASDATVNSGTIKVRYTVRTAADAPVTAMRVRVNGLLQPSSRALTLVSKRDTREIEVDVPEQDAEIQLFAENKYSISTPATLRLKWAGKATASQSNLPKPKLYVLAVGVSKYQNPDYNLRLAAKDAKDFVNSLTNQKGKLYSDVVVRLLTDDKATKDDVLEGLDWLKHEVTSRDVGIMFVAGHGMNDKLGNYYFLPHNANPDQLMRTGISQNDIKLTFASLPGKTVFFVDTCYSGSVLGTVRTSGFINDLASAENGAIVFAASSAGQLSQENASWGNGAFTKSVVEGLNGKADFRKNGLITAKGLDYYVDDRVKELTRGLQSPVSISPNGVTDFTIATVGQSKH